MSSSTCLPWARNSKPIALRFRSSYWYATFVIALAITTDLLVYSIVIPVFPFRLETLGYHGISGLVGWLIFSFSAGLVISTIPIAMLSERHSARALPLNAGIILLIGSQFMLMFARPFWLMCVARILQGFSSSIVWVVGLALICDVSPEKVIGRQLGIVMSGFSLGLLMGPSIGGALYIRFGFHGTTAFGIALAFVDLVARAFIIERKDALRWGYDPSALPAPPPTDEVEQNQNPEDAESSVTREDSPPPSQASGVDLTPEVTNEKAHISLPALFIKLCKSSRALTALGCTLVYGLIYGAIEPALPLHLHAVYRLDPSQVGITFLAISIPSLFSTPLSGLLADSKGTEWATILCLSMAIPWAVLVSFNVKVALFVIALAIESFFTSGVISPLMAELASVSRNLDGVGYAHVYGAFNIIYGIGSSVGSIIGGQMYDHIRRGWLAVCFLIVGMLGTALISSFCFIGDVPLRLKLAHRLRRQ